MKTESKTIVHDEFAEIIECEIYHYSNLNEEAQKNAVDAFFKYNLGYLNESGILDQAREDEIGDTGIRNLIIAQIDNDQDMFEEDGTHF